MTDDIPDMGWQGDATAPSPPPPPLPPAPQGAPTAPVSPVQPGGAAPQPGYVAPAYVTAQQPAAIPGTPVVVASQGPPPSGSNKGLMIALVVLGGVLVVGLAVLLTLQFTSENRTSADSSTSSSTTQTTVTTLSSSTTIAPPTAPPPQTSGGGGGGGAPEGGLLCKDLHTRGYSYPEAVGYWIREGYPDRMDADSNGIPCETVYTRAEVQAYWGTVSPPDYWGLPSGLMCQDLHNMGYSYSQAVSYWIAEGYPDRMDADLNGVPCETVYTRSEVRSYWG